MKGKKEKKRKNVNPTEKAADIVDMESPASDPGGSYTGKPDDPREVPVQDADDL